MTQSQQLQKRPRVATPRTVRAPFSAYRSPENSLSRSGKVRISRPVPFKNLFPCPPSPCPKHYLEHLSTMGTPSPWASRLLGDPEVHSFPCSVRRSVVRRLARSFRVSLGRAVTVTNALSPSSQAEAISTDCATCMTFRHRHRRRSRLIETAKMKMTRREDKPGDQEAAAERIQ